MKVPARLGALLAKHQELHGSVIASLGKYERWLADNKMPFFPEFTDHGTVHVERVMSGADYLVHAPAWPFLTAEDAATLLLAILLHDSAMHLSRDGFFTLVSRDARWAPKSRFLSKLRETSWADLWEEFCREARRWDGQRLKLIFGKDDPVAPPDNRPDTNWTDDQYRLVGEFVRRHHARLAHEMALLGIPGTTSDRVRFVEMPFEWLPDLAGFVARSHNLMLREAIDLLEPNGRKVWRRVHTPYLMTVLRIADYLELDATRAPKDILKIRGLRSSISRQEWKKHDSVHDVRRHEEDPYAIYVDCEPSDVATFLSMRALLDDLQREVDQCWNALGEVYGSDDGLRNLGLSIRRVSSSLDDVDELAERVEYVPVQARFRVSGGDVLKLLIRPLYGDKATYGVRELMQNAIDACRELEDWRAQHPDTKVDPREQPADVVVFVKEHPDGTATLTIDDRGIGMTKEVILNYFLVAGASFRTSKAWFDRHTDDDGASRVYRSGRFGVGVLAAFLLGDEVEVTTRAVTSTTGYRFCCRVDSGEIEIRKVDARVGTSIRIAMTDREKVGELVKSRQRAGQGWDWYGARSPSVLRGIEHATMHKVLDVPQPLGVPIWIQERNEIPAPASKLPPEWARLHCAPFAEVHWTPPEHGTGDGDAEDHAGQLYCNGIKVAGGYSPPMLVGARNNGLVRVVCPTVSVWDRAGDLPLTLRRDALAGRPPFADDLAEPVCRDILGYLLVRIEPTPRRHLLQLALRASGMIFWRGAPHFLWHPCISTGDFKLQSWLALTRGRTYLAEPVVLAESGADAIAFLRCELPISAPWLDAVQRLSSTTVVICQHGDVRHDGDPGPNMPNGIRVHDAFGFGSRKLKMREVLVRGALPNSDDQITIGDHCYAKRGAGNESRLIAFARSLTAEERTTLQDVVVRYVERPTEKPSPSLLEKLWLDLIGARGIPVNPDQRRDELTLAYSELREEVKRWGTITDREENVEWSKLVGGLVPDEPW